MVVVSAAVTAAPDEAGGIVMIAVSLRPELADEIAAAAFIAGGAKEVVLSGVAAGLLQNINQKKGGVIDAPGSGFGSFVGGAGGGGGGGGLASPS